MTHFFPVHGGGIEIVAGQLATHLLETDADLRIEWFASNTDATPPKTRRFRPRAMRTWNGIEARLGVPCPIWSPFQLVRLWRVVGRCDVAHLHDYAYFGNLCTTLFCRWRGKPYVVTQHIGMVPFQRVWMRVLLEKLNRTVGKWVLDGAAHVVFVSDEVRRYFEPILGRKQAHLIPNGVQSEVFAPVEEKARQDLRARVVAELGWHDDEHKEHKIALFVGRFVEKKGVRLVLELVRQMPEVRWVMAGQGPLDPKGEAKKLPNLRVLRGKRGSQIADLMRAADLLVLPSQGEGFPLVVQEALACGTPVLVEKSLANALPDVAPFLNVLDVGKTDDLLRWRGKVSEILNQENSPAARRERASFAERAWSWDECARRYYALFESVTKGPQF